MYYDNAENMHFIAKIFNYWYVNDYAKLLLKKMDINIRVKDIKIQKKLNDKNEDYIKFEIYDGEHKKLTNIQNLQVKLVTNKNGAKLAGKNQVDKRWIDAYQELWNIPKNVVKVLKHFTGEFPPYIDNPKDPRRMFINELSARDQEILFDFLRDNQLLIVSDILKGRGKFSAEWMLVIVRNKEYKITHWALNPINVVCNYFGNGEIEISPKGSIRIGKILMQRKGGDGSRPTANMLQFNIDPTKLIDV